MILGVSPREYGWNPDRDGVDQTSSATWETPGLNTVSNVAEKIVPHAIRSRIGDILTRTIEDPSESLTADDYPDGHLFTDLKHQTIEVQTGTVVSSDLNSPRNIGKISPTMASCSPSLTLSKPK